MTHSTLAQHHTQYPNRYINRQGGYIWDNTYLCKIVYTIHNSHGVLCYSSEANQNDILDRCKIRVTFDLLLLKTRKGYKQTVTVLRLDYRGTISIKSTRERSPAGSEARHQRGASVPLFDIVCYSKLFNYSAIFYSQTKIKKHI